MLGRMAGLANVALLHARCARAGGSAAIACGGPTSLVPDPLGEPGNGVHLGPLFFRDWGPDETRAVDTRFSPGYPTKVLILGRGSLAAPVTLEGWRCATGQRLRFWYAGGFPDPPLSAAEFASLGDPAPVLASNGTYTGYMLFTASGTWKIAVSQNGKVLGTAIFQVT
jgi:hypothetical protein